MSPPEMVRTAFLPVTRENFEIVFAARIVVVTAPVLFVVLLLLFLKLV